MYWIVLDHENNLDNDQPSILNSKYLSEQFAYVFPTIFYFFSYCRSKQASWNIFEDWESYWRSIPSWDDQRSELSSVKLISILFIALILSFYLFIFLSCTGTFVRVSALSRSVPINLKNSSTFSLLGFSLGGGIKPEVNREVREYIS